LDALLRHGAHGDTLRHTPIDFVVTRGAPAGNVLLAHDWRRFLVDLVELKRGPRERDLHDYPVEAWDASVDRDVVTYYKRDFALSEVAEYGGRLTRRHLGDIEDDRAWGPVGEYIAELRTL
jgi:hypothetical protein